MRQPHSYLTLKKNLAGTMLPVSQTQGHVGVSRALRVDPSDPGGLVRRRLASDESLAGRILRVALAGRCEGEPAPPPYPSVAPHCLEPSWRPLAARPPSLRPSPAPPHPSAIGTRSSRSRRYRCPTTRTSCSGTSWTPGCRASALRSRRCVPSRPIAADPIRSRKGLSETPAA